jgi:hypothetical protein
VKKIILLLIIAVLFLIPMKASAENVDLINVFFRVKFTDGVTNAALVGRALFGGDGNTWEQIARTIFGDAVINALKPKGLEIAETETGASSNFKVGMALRLPKERLKEIDRATLDALLNVQPRANLIEELFNAGNIRILQPTDRLVVPKNVR